MSNQIVKQQMLCRPVRQICVVADGVAGALVYELVCANPTLAPITDLILVNSPIAQILAARRMLSVCDYPLFISSSHSPLVAQRFLQYSIRV